MNIICGLSALLLSVALIQSQSVAAASSCDNLMSLSLAGATITSATTVVAGGFALPQGTPPGPPGTFTAFETLPAFCRVQGVIRASADSHIEFEVWLPFSGWNGKYQGTGNGGFAGSINYAEMAVALGAGYASSSTDTGHQGGATDATWALGHPDKIADFGHRAIHETAEKTKAVISVFYGVAPKRSYFSGCSNGGRQALMEAQRYPADYDGIIAGAPAAFFTHITASFDWNLLATTLDPDGYIPARKFSSIEAAALAACDLRDGVQDGVIQDPPQCHFSPAMLVCHGDESDRCLTQPQVAALQKIYAGPHSIRGNQIYPGFTPGGESGPGGWGLWISGPAPDRSLKFAFSMQGNAYMLHQDPA